MSYYIFTIFKVTFHIPQTDIQRHFKSTEERELQGQMVLPGVKTIFLQEQTTWKKRISSERQ